MSATDEITRSIPIDALAQQVGADKAEVQRAVSVAVPALLGGLHANATDPAGASSILGALGRQDAGLLDRVGSQGLGQVDPAEGEKIAGHIFGANQQAVVDRLGGLTSGAGGSDLVKRLIPLLAPIVMSYLAKQMSSAGGSAGGSAPGGSAGGSAPGASAGGGAMQQVLEQVLKSAVQGTGGSAKSSSGSGGMGSVLGDALGGLLGGGRRT